MAVAAGGSGGVAVTGPVPRVDVSCLSVEGDLGRGGQGRVAAVSGFKICGRWPAAVKVYAPDHVREVNPAVLEDMVALPRQLPAADSSWLLENTAWPSVVTEDNGQVCGFLMRAVPAGFYFDFRTRTLGSQRKLADFAFLLNPDDYLSGAGITVTDSQRLHLLASAATLLARLHDIGIVAGDLSPKNLLFSLSPTPRCFLIDCDAAQLRGQTVLRPVQTPDWEAPPAEQHATTATDAYKFGLLAIRLFARDQASHDPAPLTATAPALGRLASLSQHPDPAARPAPATWTTALDLAAAEEQTRSQATATARPAPTPITIPAPALTPPAPPATASHATTTPRRRTRWAILAATAALATTALTTTAVLRSMHPTTHPPNTRTSPPLFTGGPSGKVSSNTAQASPTPPSAVGVVEISNDAVGNPQAVTVARMFNTYFSSINNHDYRHALSVFDPRGIINPNVPSSLRTFASADSTSDDTSVVLLNLQPPDGTQVTSAEVSFQSQQATGYGPSDNPDQTCTLWDLTYELTQSPTGQYQIYGVTSDVHNGC